MHHESSPHWKNRRKPDSTNRLLFLQWILCIGGAIIIVRLAYLQVWKGGDYRAMAAGQHQLRETLIPERGKILVRDRVDQSLHPLATNRDSWSLYIEPNHLKSVGEVARELAPYTKTTEAELTTAWSKDPNDAYEPVSKGLETRQAEEIASKKLKGVGLIKGWSRFYPEKDMSGQLIGFVRTDETGVGKGVYGLESTFDDVLVGRSGYIDAQKDAGGRRLMLDGGRVRQATNGADLILTIDRSIQYTVCQKVKAAVDRFQALSATAVVLNPNTGAIIAMCSMPDFDPGDYGSVDDIGVFNNPATFVAYEPGSVFKTMTMALGIESGKIGSDTTYTDPGVEKIDRFEIKNSDEMSHGVQTMRQVLEKSLNTGTIFIQRLLGREAFRKGVMAFGFGTSTGVELRPEAKGNVSSLSKNSDVYFATASFGQGITSTPLQLAVAYGAVANGGNVMRPYVVDEIVYPDGTHKKTEPLVKSRPISSKTANLVKGMLVSVVERGHGASAKIPGYYLAGKTGTAQVANPKGSGYLEGAIISTFAGFAPADNPAFVMVIKMDRPKVGQWAESNASVLFQDIAKYLVSYMGIPVERDPNAPTEVETVPAALPPEAASGAPDVVSVSGAASQETPDGVQKVDRVQPVTSTADIQ
jgi:cell division protein FtsI/penicillin-binding protein 2